MPLWKQKNMSITLHLLELPPFAWNLWIEKKHLPVSSVFSSEMVLNSKGRFINVYFNPRNFNSFADRDLKGLNTLQAPCQQITVGRKGRLNQKVNNVLTHWERCLELDNKDRRIISCLFFRDEVVHSFLLINILNLLLLCLVLPQTLLVLSSGKFNSQQVGKVWILYWRRKFEIICLQKCRIFDLWLVSKFRVTSYSIRLNSLVYAMLRERMLKSPCWWSMKISQWGNDGIWFSLKTFLPIQAEIISKL